MRRRASEVPRATKGATLTVRRRDCAPGLGGCQRAAGTPGGAGWGRSCHPSRRGLRSTARGAPETVFQSRMRTHGVKFKGRGANINRISPFYVKKYIEGHFLAL